MTQYKRSHEPVAWSLFGAGGMAVALILPGIILTSLLVMPSVDPEHLYVWLQSLFQSWLVRIVLLAVISTTFYHAVHRMYHGLHDLHIEGPDMLMLTLFYGGATVLTIICGSWLLVI